MFKLDAILENQCENCGELIFECTCYEVCWDECPRCGKFLGDSCDLCGNSNGLDKKGNYRTLPPVVGSS